MYFITYLYGKLRIFNNCCKLIALYYCLKTAKECLSTFIIKRAEEQLGVNRVNS